jgi:hypothetical protein
MVVVLPAAAGHGFGLPVRVEGDPRSIPQSSAPGTFDIVIRGIWRDVRYHLIDCGVIEKTRSGQPVCGLWKRWQQFTWSRNDVSFYPLESQERTDRRTTRKQGAYPEAIMMSLLRDCGTP